MKWNKFPIKILIAALLVTGCVKDDVNVQEEKVVLSPGLNIRKIDGDFRENAVHKPELNSYLIAVNENSLVYSEKVIGVHEFSVGQVIYLDHPNLTDDIYFKKVLNLRMLPDGSIQLQTEDTQFDEFFSWIDLDFSYVYNNDNFQYRSFEIETKIYDLIAVECSGFAPNQYPRITPEFGVDGEIEMILNADFKAGTFDNFSFKFKDVKFSAGKNVEVNSSLACSAEISSDYYTIPPMRIVIKGVVITVDSRMSVGVKGGFDTEGRLEYDMKTTLGHPVSFDFELNPNKYPFPYYESNNQFKPFLLPDINFEFNLSDIYGRSTLAITKTYLWEFTFYNAYDFFNAFVKFKSPIIDLTFQTEESDQEININNSLDFSLVLSPGFQLNFGQIGGVSLNIDTEWDIPIYQQNAYSKEFTLPCGVNFLHADFLLNCVEDEDQELILIEFKVNSNNGSPSGFRLNVDGRDLGIFPYNTDSEVEMNSNFMKTLSRIEVRDATQPGCRFTVYEDNPCGTRAYCIDDPIVDSRDLQEYCYMTLSDGKNWLSSNLLYSASNTIGICYKGNNEFCNELGRYYIFDEVESGSICPPGWRIPTLTEWENMLNSESTGVNRIRHLLAPNLINYGNVPTEHTNGFNIIPTGQYQSWKQNLPIEERFSGGTGGNDSQFAMFWTSTPLDENSNNQFAEGGAQAVFVSKTGNYKFISTSKNAGLTCRCIEN